MRSVLIIFLLSMTSVAVAPDLQIFMIPEPTPVGFYENLIKAVVKVESSGNTRSYNFLEDAYGAFQIRPVRLNDYNKRTGKKYLMKDCYQYDVSQEIFLYYARKLGYDFESIARQWNGSGKMTIEYWKKVKKYL